MGRFSGLEAVTSSISIVTAPAITGTPQVGQVLTRVQGAYSGAGTVTVSNGRWQRNGVDIPGATGATYTLIEADEGAAIRWAELVTDDLGSRAVYAASVSVLASHLVAVGLSGQGMTGSPVNHVTGLAAAGAQGAGAVGSPAVSANHILVPMGAVGNGVTGTALATSENDTWAYSGSVVTNLPVNEGWEFTGSVADAIPTAA